MLFELSKLVTSDYMMTSLLKKLSISIKIHVVKPLFSVSKLSTESVGSRRELVANCVHTADADIPIKRNANRPTVLFVYCQFNTVQDDINLNLCIHFSP